MRQKVNSRGFTIVELLIVIVVIAILAAITVVAYNGIQTRAENTKTITAVATYVRALKAYHADKDSYPQLSYPFICLGSSSASCGSNPASTCFGSGWIQNDTGGFPAVYTAFSDALKAEITNLPDLSTQSISCSGSATVKGGIYYYVGSYVELIYYLRGNPADCGSPGGLSQVSGYPHMAGDSTMCVVLLS